VTHFEENIMPVSPELLKILVCPESHQPLSVAPSTTLATLNEKISANHLKNRGGIAITSPITEALIREDGKILYLVDDGIPVMLIEESIELS
jgi:uncharacterized protein YbaR (Trm112 family)